jgi:acetoin utilization protein AcuB
MDVRYAMTRDPVTASPDTSLRVATDLMRSKGIHHLPITDDAGRLVGILTDRDIKHAVFLPALAEHLGWDQRRFKALRVREVMTWSVLTTNPDVPLTQAAATMFQRRIGSLPVVENGRLVGILTETDVLSGLRREDKISTEEENFFW